MKSRAGLNLFIVAILASIALAAMLLFVPSPKDKRVIKLHQEEEILKQKLAKKLSKASTEDIARVKGAAQFTIPSKNPKKAADLYIFVPTLNNHIALVSGPTTNPFLGNDFRDCEIHVIPVSEKESPGSNLAMKLAILFPGPIGQSYIDFVGQHPTTSLSTLESAWSQVPQLDKDRAEAQISSNLKLSAEAGENQALLVYGPFQFKAKAWFGFRDPIFKITDFYRTH